MPESISITIVFIGSRQGPCMVDTKGHNGAVGATESEPEPVVGAGDLRARVLDWERELRATGIRSARVKANRVAKVLREAEPTPEAIREWLLDRRSGAKPIGASHAKHIRNDLIRFMKWAGGPDLSGLPEFASDDGEGCGAFSPAEVGAIIAAAEADEARADRRYYLDRSALYLLLWITTTRVGQAAKTEAADIDLEARVYRRRAQTNKTRTASLCPLSEAACERLAPLVARAAPYVWPSKSQPDRPWWPKREVLYADMREAKVPRIGPDGLPRSFTSFRKGAVAAMAEAGVPDSQAQRVLGHATYATTAKHYHRIRPTVHREIVEGLSRVISPIITTNSRAAGHESEKIGYNTAHTPEDSTDMGLGTHRHYDLQARADRGNGSSQAPEAERGGLAGRAAPGESWRDSPASGGRIAASRDHSGRAAESGVESPADDLATTLESIARLVRRFGEGGRR